VVRQHRYESDDAIAAFGLMMGVFLVGIVVVMILLLWKVFV
jgi:hypothetical protein